MTRPFAVVTGASSGIGLELARQFAEHDYDVLITAEDGGIETARTELAENGTEIIAVQADLRTYEGVEQLYNAIQATGRPVDAAAINAGIGATGEFARETALQDELDVINLNVISTVHLAKRLSADMAGRGKGSLLFTSSIAGILPGPFIAVYAASKAFVLSFAEAIRSELKDSGVTVTTLMPGPTDTNFFARADMENTPAGRGAKDDPYVVARDGFSALMAGDDHIVAGSLKNKLQATMSKFMSEAGKAEMHRKQSEPDGPVKVRS